MNPIRTFVSGRRDSPTLSYPFQKVTKITEIVTSDQNSDVKNFIHLSLFDTKSEQKEFGEPTGPKRRSDFGSF
jgi:hypothetical protein